jgi:hypothetical protein
MLQVSTAAQRRRLTATLPFVFVRSSVYALSMEFVKLSFARLSRRPSAPKV